MSDKMAIRNFDVGLEHFYNSKKEETGFVFSVLLTKPKKVFVEFILRYNSAFKSILNFESTIVHYIGTKDDFQDEFYYKANSWVQLSIIFVDVIDKMRNRNELKVYGFDISETCFPHGMTFNDYNSHFLSKLPGIQKSDYMQGNLFLPAIFGTSKLER